MVYDGFRTNGMVPGPTIRVQEGDIVEMIIENKGTIPHGASIHAAYTQTSKYLGAIPAGQSRSIKFKATIPGVYLYHCAPGGHAIPMHVMFGQYGMIVVEPTKTKFKLEEELGHGPDVEIFLIQHEWYASGKDAVEGNPTYVTFNGEIFKYVKEPITAKPGDYVRINFLNVGPNLLSTFHLVGIIWDNAYWQGHPENVLKGWQTVTAGPSDSFVIEFRIPPDEGAYTMLSHAVGSTSMVQSDCSLLIEMQIQTLQKWYMQTDPIIQRMNWRILKRMQHGLCLPLKPVHPILTRLLFMERTQKT